MRLAPKTLSAVHNIRAITKRDMVLNHLTPRMEVDAQYAVRADGELLTCGRRPPVLPLAQRYFLF